MEMDCGEMIDLTGLNDSETMTDAELAERLQMEELETMNQSDFEVARHLQEMETRRAASSSHMFPELFMFGEPMRRLNSGYHRTESRRLRPQRPPPPPRPTRVSRTSNSDEHDNDDSNDPPSTHKNRINDDDDDDVTSNNNDQQTAAAAASASSAPPSRYSMARRAQLAMNRNRGDPSACTDGASTEPDHFEDAVNQRHPAAVAAAAQDTRAVRMERLFGAMNRNRRGHPAFFPVPDFPVTDEEQSRGAAYQTRSRSIRGAPPLPTAHPNDARPNDVEESRDALNHNHFNPTTSTAPATDDAVGDAEQQDRVIPPPPPPVPPRRQRRPPRNRRMLGGSVPGHGLLPFALRHADYHDTLELPGWPPGRRHYEFSRLLDDDDGSGNNYEALWALSEQIGDAANKGLNLIQITRLPTMKYKASSSLSSSTVTSDDMMTCDDAVSSSSSSESMSDATLAEMETVCRVCLCGFENGDVLRSLPCCHRFHVDCIDQWIKQNAICPVCRDNIKDHFNGGGGRGGGGRGGGGEQWEQYQ